MREVQLFYILFIVAMATIVATGVQAAEGTFQGGDDAPTCGGHNQPDCEGEDMVGSGGGKDPGSLPCHYSSEVMGDPLEEYAKCLLECLTPEFQNEHTQSFPPEFGVTRFEVFDGDKNEPTDLCYREESWDIQSTSLTLNLRGLNAKIRKFTEEPAGDGQITVILNTRRIVYDTAGAADLETLNHAIKKRIREFYEVADDGEYWEIIGPVPFTKSGITRVGVESTDSRIFRSGIAIMKAGELSTGTYCDPYNWN